MAVTQDVRFTAEKVGVRARWLTIVSALSAVAVIVIWAISLEQPRVMLLEYSPSPSQRWTVQAYASGLGMIHTRVVPISATRESAIITGPGVIQVRHADGRDAGGVAMEFRGRPFRNLCFASDGHQVLLLISNDQLISLFDSGGVAPTGTPAWPTIQGIVRWDSMPLWVPLLMFLILPARSAWQWLRAARKRAGHCTGCGYDLRASEQRCPECGLAIPAVSVEKQAFVSP